jgi:hypothetical protein
MSAPTALEAGALLRGIAWRVRPQPLPFWTGPDTNRRSAEPIAELGRQHDVLCRQACDPLEIAAVLEAAGLDDRRSRSDFQAAGVFEVAEQLWSRVPWRPATDGPRTDLWRLPLWRAQLRGVLYAVPALLATAAVGQVHGGGGDVLLLLATTISIGIGQALSVLGHLLSGRGQARAVRTLAAVTVGGAVAVTAVTAAVSTRLGGPVRLDLAAGGQLVFVVAATLVMLRGADRLLLALITPGAAVVAGQLLGAHLEVPLHISPNLVLLGAPALTVLAVAVAACWQPRRAGEGEPLRRALGRPELVAAAVAGCYGLALSGVVSWAVIGVLLGRVRDPGAAIVWATLPMTATFGIAEYLLHRARSRATTGLGRAHLVNGFVRGSRGELRMMVALHLATATAVAAGVLLLTPGRHPDPVVIGFCGGYALLAVALLLSTTLMSLGYIGLAACLAAGGAAALLLPEVVSTLRDGALLTSQLGALALLLVVAYRLTVVRFATATAHR